ncbi:DnaJ domain protein [Gammaproteobacteria bacterium]
MILKDALNLLGIIGDNITLKQCKNAYRSMMMKYHPDRNPAGLEIAKALNAAWDYIQKLDWTRPVSNKYSDDIHYVEALSAFINAMLILDGILIEVCGSWVWLSGDTKPHKDTIKAAGGKWAPKKQQWYFRPKEWKSSNHQEWDMDRIRDSFGSQGVARNRRREEETAKEKGLTFAR